MRILVLQGPNLNMLGKREAGHYGTLTLDEIHKKMSDRAASLSCDLEFCQSNHEGDLVDKIQSERDNIDGIILNPAGLTGVGYSLRDAIEDSGVPTVEVHLSNIHAREAFRSLSVISAVAVGQIVGFRWRGYLAALEILAGMVDEKG